MLIRALAPFQIEFDGKLRLQLQTGQLADVPGTAGEDAIARGAARAAAPGEAGLPEPEPEPEAVSATPQLTPPPFAITLLGDAPPPAAAPAPVSEDDEPTEPQLAEEED